MLKLRTLPFVLAYKSSIRLTSSLVLNTGSNIDSLLGLTVKLLDSEPVFEVGEVSLL